jgi:sugar phosphate isomerase/epimerase
MAAPPTPSSPRPTLKPAPGPCARENNACASPPTWARAPSACTWAPSTCPRTGNGRSNNAISAARPALPAYLRLRDQIIAARTRRQPPFFEAARRSLDELAALAIRYGLRLGVESRRQYREIPSFEELGILLADHAPATVGFWYDPGHVQVLANLGFHQHQPWLDLFAARIVGVHLHDVIGLRDHLLPGLGELDFAHIGRHLPADAVRTFELDWYYEEQELQTGLAHARAAGCVL